MKVLIVDDHKLFLDGLQVYLQGESEIEQVLLASNATDAFEIVQKKPEIDIILLDLDIPGIDGHGFLSMLHEHNVLVPVIILSGTEQIRGIQQALDKGAMGFIPKTYSGSAVLSSINEVLAGNIYLPSEVLEKLNDLNQSAEERTISSRQIEVLKLMNTGLSNKQIAFELALAEQTVKTHVGNLFQVLQVTNRLECIRKAESMGYISKPNTASF